MIPLRVLLVDDTTDMRRLLRSLLEVTGRFAVVGEAANGRTAITMTEELSPDAIVLDLAMPVLDGLQAIPQLREVAPDAAIVVFSGLEMDRAAKAALLAGADRYVEKGTAISHLADEIDAARATRPQTPPSVAPAPPAERPAAPVGASTGLAASLTGVAHDLRTPLTVLAGAVRTLETRWHHLTDADRTQLIAMLRRSTDRMNAIVGDLDEAGRIDAGEIRTNAARFDIRELITRAVDSSRAAFPARRFTVATGDAPLVVRADHRKQMQVLQTLLARVARTTDDEISVVVGREGDAVRITISHEMSATADPRAPRHVEASSGLGLDLAIARSYVEADGGALDDPRSGREPAIYTYTVPTSNRAELAS